MNIIGPSTHVLDLGVSMSSNSTVDLIYYRFIVRYFTFLICINDAQILLAEFSEHLLSEIPQ